ncbi:MAG TPA: alpha/beta fold hydrolase [Streptosporangiaceae bacterium]|jgi:hypothetical protein
MNATPDATAMAVIEMAQQGRFTDISERYAPQLRPMVPPEALRGAWEAELAKHGPLISAGTPLTEPAGPGTVIVKVPLTFERGALTAAVGVAGEQSWVTGIQLLPASAAAPAAPWQPPPYADQGRFTEAGVTLGAGPLAVPGTLSVPHKRGPVPGVVLLSGSGAHDQDETIGRNKPLKDLAWGLASRGVAVLRFEKVTHAHPALVAADRAFTLTSEYVPHAVAGLRQLREHPAVDAARIFVAGHSLGGSVAPRAAAAGPAVAGLVILAGGAQPLHWAAVRQFRYLASLEPGRAAAAQPALDVITAQAQAVDDPGLSESTPSGTLPFGAPAAYWLDVRGYDPPAAAAALRKPLLVLQGGRDYQVTTAEDLSRWQAALDARPDVTVRVYPADNHLFFPGAGPSSPAEYEPAQHVDPDVIADIATWLTR